MNLENIYDDLGTKASTIAFSHLSDIQIEKTIPELHSQVDFRIEFIKFIISNVELNKKVNANKLFQLFKLRNND